MSLKAKDKLMSKSNSIKMLLLLTIAFACTNYLFNSYESELSEVTAKTANILRGNSFALREFDSNGIPYSNFARLKKKTISPFYVVHYGLIYSQNIPAPAGYNHLWEKQKSVKYWNVQPDNNLITEENFYHSANWVVNHINQSKNGGVHLFYDFDWPYLNLKTGGLKAPWYSGLTDGMALTLLCRAYVLTKDLRYKSAAFGLYESLVKPIDKGGSLISLENGDPWIEEYVDSRLPDHLQSKVLNGMIYATFGVIDFENTFSVDKPVASRLLKSIRNNINEFDLGWWTSYDRIGTVANLKYHHVHIGLLDDLYSITNDPYFLTLKQKWDSYQVGFLERNFIRGAPTINSWMMLIEFILLLLTINLLLQKLLKTNPIRVVR